MTRDMISLETVVERALLVGAPMKGAGARRRLDEHLEELSELADTAGATVVGEVTQLLDRPHPGTYLGSGKLEELKSLIDEKQATLVIFDDELTPAQLRNIENAVGKRVMDRAELILDIFAVRARTSEAKMQVELAQLEYLLPRLTRMWTHLEKFRGGIGMRGPGETQLETDRRLIGHRIGALKDKLADVQRARAVQRSSRRTSFRASLVGYTNAGKILDPALARRCARTSSSRTACSRRSTRSRARWTSANRSACSSPTPWASSGSCRTISSRASARRSKRCERPIFSCT